MFVLAGQERRRMRRSMWASSGCSPWPFRLEALTTSTLAGPERRRMRRSMWASSWCSPSPFRLEALTTSVLAGQKRRRRRSMWASSWCFPSPFRLEALTTSVSYPDLDLYSIAFTLKSGSRYSTYLRKLVKVERALVNWKINIQNGSLRHKTQVLLFPIYYSLTIQSCNEKILELQAG